MSLSQRSRPTANPGERWVIVTQYYPPEPGAPQIRLHTLARKLTKQGIHVRVLTGMPNYPTGKLQEGYRGKLSHREEIDGIEVQRVWLYPATGRSAFKRIVNYLSFSFTATFYLLFCMRQIDVVFVESQPISLGIAGLLLKWLRGVPYIYNIPDLQTDAAKQLGFVRSRLFLRLAVSVEDLFMRQSWTVSTVTRRFIDYYVERGIPREQISFLPNGADTDVLKPLPLDEEYAERMGVSGKKVFTYAGTHAFYHGLEVLVEAARLLRHRRDIAILLVGEGPVREPLKQLARDYALTNIVFGQSPFAQMSKLMSITYASLVVMKDIAAASKMRLSKTFPPLACGVPVIYSGFGESADMVAEHQCGLCVAPENAQQLAAAIESLADDPALRGELGANGVRLIQRELSWSRIIADWLNQLRDPRPQREASVRAHLLKEAS
jgi:glycosyltransferase involved in cell wall biosynthesis